MSLNLHRLPVRVVLRCIICLIGVLLLFGCRTKFGGAGHTKDAGSESLCGNGLLDDGEECDDGNSEDGDGCDSNCRIEPGWHCEGEPSVCEYTCGDGIKQEWEECDGDDLGGKTCESLAEGFKGGELGCYENCTFDKTWCISPKCGDGVLDLGEECDEGDQNSNEGACLLNCMKAFCGDGFVWEGVEECDDGPDNSDTEPFVCRTDCRAAIEATGGEIEDITVDGRRWRVHTFRSDGVFEVTKIGSLGDEVEYLILAGGGGGGAETGGGGGGGGLFSGSTMVAVTSYQVGVGSGGSAGSNGQSSSFMGITPSGGGRGGRLESNGFSGGCGGGAGGIYNLPQPSRSGGSGNPGNRGGNRGASSTGITAGAGGGGMGTAGEDVSGDRRTGGKGGDGISSSITGSAVTYGGGGGGGGSGGSGGGAGGKGGGGAGSFTGTGSDGSPNTGGGGGGGGYGNNQGGRGGSGIVVIRYPMEH